MFIDLQIIDSYTIQRYLNAYNSKWMSIWISISEWISRYLYAYKYIWVFIDIYKKGRVHILDLNLCHPTHSDSTLPLSHEVVSIYPKRKVYDSSSLGETLATSKQFFACRIFIFRLLKLNIKTRRDILKFSIAIVCIKNSRGISFSSLVCPHFAHI